MKMEEWVAILQDGGNTSVLNHEVCFCFCFCLCLCFCFCFVDGICESVPWNFGVQFFVGVSVSGD